MGIAVQIILTLLTALLWALKALGIIAINWFLVILPVFIVPLFWGFLFLLGHIIQLFMKD